MTPADKRRPHGTGGLYKRASDGLWVGTVDVGWTATGARKRKTVSSKSRQVAARKLKELQRAVAAGEVGVAGSARATVKTWAEQWLPMHAADVRPTTYATDAGAIRKWIVPTIGHRRLADLTPADLRALREAIVGAGRTSTTAHHAHTVLAKMLRDAIREGHQVPERVMVAKKPTKAVNDRAAIPVDQGVRLLLEIGRRDDSSRWLLGIMYGLRQGEVLGLDWEHVDLDAGTVHVEWQLQRLPAKHVQPDGFRARHLIGPMWQTETKTASGSRVLPLTPPMHASLAAAKELWVPNPWGLVWTDRGQPIRDEHDRATWKAIQTTAGVAHPSGRPWHGHECRHTVATLLMRQGTPRTVAAQILGQSKMLDDYLHPDGADALTALEGVLRQLTPPPD